MITTSELSGKPGQAPDNLAVGHDCRAGLKWFTRRDGGWLWAASVPPRASTSGGKAGDSPAGLGIAADPAPDERHYAL